MTDWTPPTHVAPNDDLDSGKFNAETVDNLLHLHTAKALRLTRVAATIAVPDQTWVSVNWNTVLHQTGGTWWANGTYPERITPTLPGVYAVNVTILFPPDGSGVRAVRLQKNGVASVMQDTRPGVASNTHSVGLSATVELDGVGDYINVHVWQNSGSTLVVPINTSNSIDVYRIGA